MRQCRIYRCSKQPGAPCRMDCSEEGCEQRCLNHPDRCRCWRDGVVRGQDQQVDHGQIISLRGSGMTIAEIAKSVGCSRKTVARHLRKELEQRE